MKKLKRFLIAFASLLLVFTIIPTTAKYTVTINGEAWKTAFSTFNIVKTPFAITNNSFDSTTGNATSSIMWGTGTNEGSSDDYLLHKLQDVEFSVQNMSNENVLITFYINISLHWISNINSNINFTIINTYTKDEATGYLTKSDTDNNVGAIYFNIQNPGAFQYKVATATINPERLYTEDQKAILERSFVVPKDGGAATYNVNIAFSNIIGGSEATWSKFVSVQMVAIPYNK